jgi:hypothetical protein
LINTSVQPGHCFPRRWQQLGKHKHQTNQRPKQWTIVALILAGRTYLGVISYKNKEFSGAREWLKPGKRQKINGNFIL